VGVAPDARIMPLRIVNASGTFASYNNIAAAIRYAVDMGAKIINCSWTFYQSPPSVITDAILYAYQQGRIVVAAAGNSNTSVSSYYPATMDQVIAVAATGPTDDRARYQGSYFSNYGSDIYVSAPGEDILSLRAAGTDVMGSAYRVPAGDPNAEYYRAWGTSMAAPIVSGIIALMLAQDPTIVFADILRRLRFSSVD
jgi:subtilisin family serine protease